MFSPLKKNPKERVREKHSAHLYHHRMIREGSKSGCVTTYMIDITVVTRPKISLKEDMVFRLCNILVLLQLCSSGREYFLMYISLQGTLFLLNTITKSKNMGLLYF